MSLLSCLLKEGDWEGARSLMTANPQSIVFGDASARFSRNVPARSPSRGVISSEAEAPLSDRRSRSESAVSHTSHSGQDTPSLSTLPLIGEDPSIFYALGDVETLEHLLLHSAESAWSVNEEGSRPLHAACQTKGVHIDVIKILLYAFPEGASIKNIAGKLPLHCAAASLTDPEAVSLVYGAFKQAVVVKEARNASKPLHYACAFRAPLPVVQLLVEMHPEALDEPDRQGHFPLHLALIYDASSEVRVFLLNKAPSTAHVRDKKGRLPIHMAVQSKTISTEVLTKLLELFPSSVNAAVSSGNDNEEINSSPSKTYPWIVGKKPIHIALRYLPDRVDVVQCLLSDAYAQGAAPQGGEASSVSAQSGTVSEEEDALSAQKNSCDMEVGSNHAQAAAQAGFYLNGDTLLHTAIEFGSPADVLDAIVNLRPSSLKELNYDGKLPIHFAAWRQVSAETMVFLIRAFPESLGISDERTGNLPLHFALQYAPRGSMDTAMIEKVLSYRASACYVVNKAGFYPIHLATQSACPVHVIQSILKISPYSYAFVSDNHLRLLPIDMAIASGASAAVIGLMLGYTEVSDTIKPKRILEDRPSSSPLLESKGEAGQSCDPHCNSSDLLAGYDGMVSLMDAHVGLQQQFKQQGEDMRKMRMKNHALVTDLKARNDEIKGLQKDVSWGRDRIKILERETKALTEQLKRLGA